MGLETIFGKGEKERNVKKVQREWFTFKAVSHVSPPSFSPFTISPAHATERFRGLLLSSGTDFLYDGEPFGTTTVQASKCHHVNLFPQILLNNLQTRGRHLRYFLVLKHF